jgi:oligosaccharide repeat unit polymerase
MVEGCAEVRRTLDISRPDVLFGLCWGVTLLLSYTVPVAFSVDPDIRVTWLVGGNIVSFFVIYSLVKWSVARGEDGSRIASLRRDSWDEATLLQFLRILLGTWAAVYFVTIVYSGGLPVFWLVLGSGKSYTDFGVPTLTGLLNMMRAFILSAYLLLFVQTRRKSYLWVPLLMLGTAVAEVSRGALLVLLAQGVGIVVLRRQPSLYGLIRLAVLVVLVVLGFGVLGDFRGSSLEVDDLVGEQSFFSELPLGVFFAFVYLVSPLNNLDYAADTLSPSYTPYFTASTLFPTVLRDVLFPMPEGTYPVELKSEAFNATTFYSPLLADFGWIGAAVIVCLIQWACSYVHVRSRQGSYYHTLLYPPLYMSVLLSVFYMYFFSLVTVCYPLLVGLFVRYRNARLGVPRHPAPATMPIAAGSGS